MGNRFLAPVGVLITLVIGMLLAQAPIAAQQTKPAAAKAPAKKWTQSRTPWGDPDLQGVYTFATETPFQRPAALGTKDSYTEEEQKRVEEELKAKQEENVDTNEHFSYNALWFNSDQGRPTGRTSLLVDPENGRMPPFTPQAEKMRAALQAKAAANRIGKDQLINTWADHPIYTRCIARPMPRITQEYNHGVEILQTPGYVHIFYESMHDVRTIPLDGRPHIDKSLRQWNGDSRGHWEGDTLVVDQTNFSDKQLMLGSAPFGGLPQSNMHLTERFTKVDPNTVNYTVTVDDPATWTKPFTFILPWKSDDPAYGGPEDLFEYACHEGNFRMMEDTLTGSRALKEAQAKK
jgi:hypothetical protein